MMARPEPRTVTLRPPLTGSEAWVRFLSGWLLGALLLAVYLANGREIGSYDTIPTTLLPLSILRGEGPYLDRFSALLFEPDGRRASYVAFEQGHLLSRYPVAASYLAAPFYWPRVAYLDRTKPGWDANPVQGWVECHRMGKISAAVIVALTGVAMFHLLAGLELGLRAATMGTLAAMLGSDLWSVASQALWQHGPAALFLTLTLLLLRPREPGPGRILLAGLTAGMLVACRSIDAIFPMMLVIGLAWERPRQLAWFLPSLIAVGGLLVAYNLYHFDSLTGGQAALEAMHPVLHDKPAGILTGDLLEGALGTLVSPSRGLFVYSPWVLVSLALLPWTARYLKGQTALKWATIGLLPFFLLLAKYPVWWAGHCFGPRYWTDAMPLFGVLATLGLGTVGKWQRSISVLLLGVVVFAAGVQGVGAFYYPSSWNLSPTNIDRDHDRLWDWTDNEVTRCLREKAGIGGRVSADNIK